MRLRHLTRGAGLTLGALALIGLNPASMAQASHAAAGDAAQVACKQEAASGARSTDGKGRGKDHEDISVRKLHRINADIAETARRLGLLDPATGKRATSARTSTTSTSSLRLANPLYINVYVHNVYGSHAGERDIGNAVIKKAIYQLSRDYTRGEAGYAPYTRFRFRLMAITLHRNDAFYHAEPDQAADIYWRKQYHRGDRNDLNIYLRAMDGFSNSGLLGYSTFPWDYARNPRLDGVNVHPESLPGRKLTHYNEGDTLTHEVGHWLGLLHPFENECSTPNDGVVDTAPQAQLDSCPAPARTCVLQSGYSNPGNYMQYTYDSCMVAFTKGQVARLDSSWTTWRQ